MATKTVTKAIDNTIKTVNKTSIKLNDFALKSTEKVIYDLFDVAGKWQKFTNKTIKSGLKFTAKQQDMIFDTLDSAKGKVVEKSKVSHSKN